MSAIPMPTEEECYLLAIFDDPSGIELAEFVFLDEEQEDGCFRCWDFQWPLYRCEDTYQIDYMARSLGKSTGIQLRAFAFPFNFPGMEMLITAPELNHLRAVTDKVEHQILSHRLSRELLPKQRGNGINHQPQFQVHFANNTRIISRLPNRDGRGVKGMHPLVIEADEMQDYPECFPAGTLVTTREGQIAIEKVQVGDLVLTHRNRWRRVSATAQRRRPAVLLRGQGHPGLVVSASHPFLASKPVRTHQVTGGRAVTVHGWSDPTWVEAKDLKGARWCSPTAFPKVKGGAIPAVRGLGRRPVGWVPPVDVADPCTYWMAGLYLAEGSITGSVITFSIHEKEVEDVLDGLRAAGLKPKGPYLSSTSKGARITVCDLDLAVWLGSHFGQGSFNKAIPSWALGLPVWCREQLLAGLIYGDGFHDADPRYTAGRMKLSTVSKALAVSVRLLAISLGYHVSTYWCDTSSGASNGDFFYQVVFNAEGQGYDYENRRFTTVRDVVDLGREEDLYDLTVEEDESFLADGFIVHNCGWIELIETMKSGVKGAQWRCHGVSRGIRDRYYRYTTGEGGDLPFTVHRYMAMHRPFWSAEERKNKIAIYGGTEDNVDYRRNIYGEHGDATNPVFVLARLMGCVRMNESPWATTYNEDVYSCIKVNDEMLRRAGTPIQNFLDLPMNHKDKAYTSFWAGMDVGYTRDPSEILVFGEMERKGEESLLRLLARIHLMRISAADQAEAVRHLFGFYGERMRRFSLDKTGNGLPLWQELAPELVGTHETLRRTPDHIAVRIKGYGFSQKVAVDFDDRPLVGRERPEDAVIEKNIVDFATDELRKLVDARPARIELPNDRELLTEWQGQEVQYVRDEGSAAGIKRRYGGEGGSFHTLDAAKMMIAGRNLQIIDEVLARPGRMAPTLDRFFM